jgi:hypothetical protein
MAFQETYNHGTEETNTVENQQVDAVAENQPFSPEKSQELTREQLVQRVIETTAAMKGTTAESEAYNYAASEAEAGFKADDDVYRAKIKMIKELNLQGMSEANPRVKNWATGLTQATDRFLAYRQKKGRGSVFV